VPFHAIVITPDAEALSSRETMLIIYAFNIGADKFIIGAKRLATPRAAFEIANRTPISASCGI